MQPSFFKDARRAGLYHLPIARQPLIEELATGARQLLLTADLRSCSGLTETLGKLGKALAFPVWYGANLDALHDCLTDPDWYPERGVIIQVNGLDALRQNDPEAFSTMLEVFDSAAHTRSAKLQPLWILLSTPTRGIAHLPEA